MVAPRKYPDELRERAIRLVLDAKAEPGSAKGACARIGNQLGINPETLRGWVAQAEVDAGVRPGTTTRMPPGSMSWSGKSVSCAGRTRF
jgi:transposase